MELGIITAELERAAYGAQTVDAFRAYAAALEEELEDMGDQRTEAESLAEQLATAEERLNSMEADNAEQVAALEATISRLEDALQDAGASAAPAEACESAPAQAPAICSAGLPTVATHGTWGEIIELRTIDNKPVRVARTHFEDPNKAILPMFTRTGTRKPGWGIARGNLLTDGAELTPAAQLESALKAHGWRVARYPRSAEQRAKLAGMGFDAIIQTAPGQFEPHPLGLAWAKPGAVVASGEEIAPATPAPKQRTAWAEFNGARQGNFPRAELLINDHAAKVSHYAARIYTRGATCNTSALKPAGWQETEEAAIQAASEAGDVVASGEDEAAPSAATTSGEDEARAAVGTPDRAEKIQTVELHDRDGRAWRALAGVPKGCDSLHALTYGAAGVAHARVAKLRAAGISAAVRGRWPHMIEINPPAELADEACPTLLPGRWIPGGAENAERIAFDAALGAEVWLIASSARPGALAVIAYAGKRTKHDAHYTMRDRAQALTWAGEYMGKQQAAAQRQADRRAEKAAKRAAGHKLKAGDVLRCSWGYDQTNIDYYEVTRLIGARMVEIRAIGAESVNDGGLAMTGDCVPRPGHYIGAPMRKAVSDYDGQSVRIASYASAHKIEPREVGGVKVYPVDHWTAYA